MSCMHHHEISEQFFFVRLILTSENGILLILCRKKVMMMTIADYINNRHRIVRAIGSLKNDPIALLCSSPRNQRCSAQSW